MSFHQGSVVNYLFGIAESSNNNALGVGQMTLIWYNTLDFFGDANSGVAAVIR